MTLTTQRETHLADIRSIRAETLAIIDGMDYCLDWKPDPASWSVRESIYHLADTPSGGLHRLIAGILSDQILEFDLTPDRHNMTPERQSTDMAQVVQDITQVLDGLESAVSVASDEDITGKSALAHLTARGVDEARTSKMLLEGLFARHWREHLEQLKNLREALGM